MEDTIRARKGALQLAVTNAGTIPDRGLYGVHLPDGRRVGELDEEMVYEARPGQTFLLGASTWRIEEITRDRVIVTPAPGAPGAVPVLARRRRRPARGAGRGDRRVRARGGGPRARPSWRPSTTSTSAPPPTCPPTCASSARPRACVPSDRTIVVERFRDEIGDWRLCVLSPFGGRVHAAWALALSARIRDEFGLESDAIWSDDGIIVHLPDADEPPGAELVLVEPDELEELVVRELSGSALFGARFRENAARALLLPRAYPGKRTPLWQQRLKAQSLLEVAKRYGQFPIVLETYRECLRDVFDLPGLEELLRGLHTRELSLVEVETQRASPFASSLLFDYVATYMYEGDTPNAERRAAALSLDRDLLRELLGQEELRELIDPDALAEVEADLQRPQRAHARGQRRRPPRRAARRGRPDRRGGAGALPRGGRRRSACSASSRRERRAVRMRIGGEERWIASEDAGLYRDALGAVPPGGLPEAFLEEVEEPLAAAGAPLRAHPRPVHHRASCRDRYGIDLGPVLRELERGGRPGARRAAPRRQRARVVRPRGAAPAAARLAGQPAQGGRARRAAGAGALPARLAGRGPARRRAAPASTACASCWCRCRAWRSRPRCGSATCCRAASGAYSPAWMDQLCAGGELVWVGAGALGRRSGRVALYFREDARWLGPPPFKGERARGPLHDAHPRAARSAAPRSGPTCWPTSPRSSRPSCRRRSGTWPGRAR